MLRKLKGGMGNERKSPVYFTIGGPCEMDSDNLEGLLGTVKITEELI